MLPESDSILVERKLEEVGFEYRNLRDRHRVISIILKDGLKYIGSSDYSVKFANLDISSAIKAKNTVEDCLRQTLQYIQARMSEIEHKVNSLR